MHVNDHVDSPCISVCKIDGGTNCCMGCYRHIDEIANWAYMSGEQKRQVLANIEKRKPPRPSPVPDS